MLSFNFAVSVYAVPIKKMFSDSQLHFHKEKNYSQILLKSVTYYFHLGNILNWRMHLYLQCLPLYWRLLQRLLTIRFLSTIMKHYNWSILTNLNLRRQKSKTSNSLKKITFYLYTREIYSRYWCNSNCDKNIASASSSSALETTR